MRVIRRLVRRATQPLATRCEEGCEKVTTGPLALTRRDWPNTPLTGGVRQRGVGRTSEPRGASANKVWKKTRAFALTLPNLVGVKGKPGPCGSSAYEDGHG